MSEFTQFVDLASERLGGRVVAANDEFFAPKENLLKHGKPGFYRREIYRPGKVDGRVGNAAAADSGMRLVHRAAGPAGNFAGRGGGHEFFYGKLSGAIFSGGMRSGRFGSVSRRKEEIRSCRDALGRDFAGDSAERRLRKSRVGDSCRAFYARALQNLSGWRRGALAVVWRGGARPSVESRNANWIWRRWKMAGG